MQNAQYWKKRSEALENMAHQDAMQTASYIEQQYAIAKKEIADRTQLWFQKYAVNNSVSLADAQKELTAGERKDFKMTLDEYIKHGEELENSTEWLTAMKNASAKHHITRLDALKTDLQQSCEKLYGKQLDAMNDVTRKVYEESYYHEVFNIQQGTGVGVKINTIDNAKLEKVIKKPWTPDGEEFSSRIWKNKQKMLNELHTEITQSCISGRPIGEISKRMAGRLNVSYSNAKRLVQTESAHFASQGDLEAYSTMGLEQYQILATLDDRTSDICQDMDGQVFDTKDFSEGMTAPPFHANCRTTTMPYFNDEFTAGEMRSARGEDGQTYEVPADMTYKEWKNRLVSDEAAVDVVPAAGTAKTTEKDGDKQEKSDIIKSGVISGARNPYGKAAEKHADKYYKAVRKMKTDIENVSRNTGYSRDDIAQVKNYLFIEEHALGSNGVRRFYPDFMIAESWQRLIAGNIEPHDLTMLNHELLERELVNKGIPQDKAHIVASKKYNYSKEASEFYGKIKKYKKE